MSNCKYYELITETRIEAATDCDGNPVPVPVEYPVGEACHKKETYDFSCDDCKDYEEETK